MVQSGRRAQAPSIDQITFYIGNAFSPSFSPDGSQVMFVNRLVDQPDTLWVIGRRRQERTSDLLGAGRSRRRGVVARMEIRSPSQ